MVRKPIKNWLSAIFELPVLEHFDQTKTEQAISYELGGNEINVRYYSGYIIFELSFNILYRCPAGFPGIGFLSVKLSDTDKQVPGFNLKSTDGSEFVTYETKSEMIISKPIRATVKIQYNEVKELIKFVNLGDLTCHAKHY